MCTTFTTFSKQLLLMFFLIGVTLLMTSSRHWARDVTSSHRVREREHVIINPSVNLRIDYSQLIRYLLEVMKEWALA